LALHSEIRFSRTRRRLSLVHPKPVITGFGPPDTCVIILAWEERAAAQGGGVLESQDRFQLLFSRFRKKTGG
jgi:hypothetical protein